MTQPAFLLTLSFLRQGRHSTKFFNKPCFPWRVPELPATWGPARMPTFSSLIHSCPPALMQQNVPYLWQLPRDLAAPPRFGVGHGLLGYTADEGRWGAALLVSLPRMASLSLHLQHVGPQSSRVTLRDRHPVRPPARSSSPGVKTAASSTRVKNAVPGRAGMWSTPPRAPAKEHPLPASCGPPGAERLLGARACAGSLPAPLARATGASASADPQRGDDLRCLPL